MRNRSSHSRKIRDDVDSTVSLVAAKRKRLGVAPDRLLVLRFSSFDRSCRDVLEERFDAVVVDERVQQENGKDIRRLIVQFATAQGIERFRAETRAYGVDRLGTTVLPRGLRKTFFSGLERIRPVSREERTGNRLRAEGFPDEPEIQLDVDLWHPGSMAEARAVLDDLRTVCSSFEGRVTDDLRTSSLILARVVGSRALGEALLDLDYVAQVNLPPLLPSAYGALFQNGAAIQNRRFADGQRARSRRDRQRGPRRATRCCVAGSWRRKTSAAVSPR